jgi:peptidoglycan/xylan/chitin deacetylase (PgdA/CDA1 family)
MEKDHLLERLGTELGVDYGDLLARRILHVMNHDEVRELAGKGVDFQLHTHRHRTPMDRAAFEREIEDNRRDLRHLLGHDVSHFCYPSGFYRPQFLEWLRDAGVESATTCEGGLASKDSPPLLLPRVVDGGQLAPIEFEAWLCGAGAWLPRRSSHTGANDVIEQ